MSIKVLVIQNEESDPPGIVGDWLAHDGIELDVVRAYAGQAVPTQVPDGYHGVMAFGGAMGATDDADHPWLADERDLLSDAVARDLPVFGVCLGGQLLAASIGATVERSPVIEIGVSRVSITQDAADDDVFGHLAGSEVPAAQWHQDWIVGLPPSATVLAANDAAPVQAFRVASHAYGVQFHPEVDAPTFESWREVADEAAQRSGVDVAAAADEVRAAERDLVTTWRPVFAAWAGVVTGRHR